MQTRRARLIDGNVNSLIQNFEGCLGLFSKKPPFSRAEQLEYHRQTIQRRLSLGSVSDAINDNVFLESLYGTLRAWGIGVRASNLVSLARFEVAIQNQAKQMASLEGLTIDNTQLDTVDVSSELWRLIDALDLVENDAKLVAGTKALHHILPDLVVPMDRAYTQRFFTWHSPEFQYKQREFFDLAFGNLVKIARATDPVQYVGQANWHTSRTKVLDNAVVGFIMGIELENARQATQS